MQNNPLADAALAELDRIYAAATKGIRKVSLSGYVDAHRGEKVKQVSRCEKHKDAKWDAAIYNSYPALRQRLTDAEARLAEAERERDQLRALADAARDGMRQLGEELEASRAEAERERGSNDALKQACDRHHEAYKVAERERVALVKRSHNHRVEIGRLIEQLTAATACAESAEALVAVLRGALDIARVKLDWIRQNAEPPAIDGGIGSVWRAAISAHAEVVAALSLTPASAGNRTDEETEAANAR